MTNAEVADEIAKNPKIVERQTLLKQVFLKYAFDKAQKQIFTEAEELKSKQLHQKPEVAKIDILETRDDFVMTQVTGQLIRTGIFEQKAFSESIPFKLSFKMRRNPDMTRNGRFPTAVSDFKYEPAR